MFRDFCAALRSRLARVGTDSVLLILITVWEFPKIRVPHVRALIIRTLLFRILYWGPLFSETPMSWHMRTRRFALTLLIVGCTHELNFFSPLMLKSEWQTPAEPSDCHQLLELPTNTRSWNPSMDAASGLRKSLQAYFRPQDIGTREMKATFKSAQDALQRYHRKHRFVPTRASFHRWGVPGLFHAFVLLEGDKQRKWWHFWKRQDLSMAVLIDFGAFGVRVMSNSPEELDSFYRAQMVNKDAVPDIVRWLKQRRLAKKVDVNGPDAIPSIVKWLQLKVKKEQKYHVVKYNCHHFAHELMSRLT